MLDASWTGADTLHVIGTAGHVDHGKSTLVHALTGIDPDRLQEEKERGLTIDLGFAWMPLSDGSEVSIVDVPGHERFVNNMLAGVGGIDLALLVVAADESVMPQTREHLAILDLLNVSRGLVAVTKRDLVDDEWLELVIAEVQDVVEGTTLEGVPIIPVSATTGDGLTELTSTVEALLQETRCPQGPRTPAPRARPGVHDVRLRHRRHRHIGRWDPERRPGSRGAAAAPHLTHTRPPEPQEEAGHGVRRARGWPPTSSACPRTSCKGAMC